jgi:hypothetical protein
MQRATTALRIFAIAVTLLGVFLCTKRMNTIVVIDSAPTTMSSVDQTTMATTTSSSEESSTGSCAERTMRWVVRRNASLVPAALDTQSFGRSHGPRKNVTVFIIGDSTTRYMLEDFCNDSSLDNILSQRHEPTLYSSLALTGNRMRDRGAFCRRGHAALGMIHIYGAALRGPYPPFVGDAIELSTERRVSAGLELFQKDSGRSAVDLVVIATQLWDLQQVCCRYAACKPTIEEKAYSSWVFNYTRHLDTLAAFVAERLPNASVAFQTTAPLSWAADLQRAANEGMRNVVLTSEPPPSTPQQLFDLEFLARQPEKECRCYEVRRKSWENASTTHCRERCHKWFVDGPVMRDQTHANININNVMTRIYFACASQRQSILTP